MFRREEGRAATGPEATGRAASRRSGDDDHSRAAGSRRGARPFAVRAAQPRQQGEGAARAARSRAPDLPARPRSHHPFEGVSAAGGQDPGVSGARGRSLPDPHHAHAGGRADRPHRDAGSPPERDADGGDRDGPRPRPHAVRPRGREGPRQADAGRLPPRQAVAARGREAGTRRPGPEPQRRGARRHPETFQGQGAYHFGQPEPDGDDAGGTDRPHQRHRRLRQSRSRRRRPWPGRGSRHGSPFDPRRSGRYARRPDRAHGRRHGRRRRAWRRSGRSG